MRVAVLTISDATSRGERADGSGDAAVAWVSAIGGALIARAVVSDDVLPIVRQIITWCDGDVADLVLTTGGTGLSTRDVTPEATRAALDREAPGIAERLRAVTGATFPRAALSRGIAGVRGRTLVVNLPGSTSGVRDMLAAFEPIARHAVDIVRGNVGSHDAEQAGRAGAAS
jgi:molybdopterin adenylyltransferase